MKRSFWLILTTITLLFLTAVALNLSPYLRGPEEWRWAYALPGRPSRHLLPLTAAAVYIWLVWQWLKSPHKPWRVLVVAAVAVPVIQLALLWAEFDDVRQPLFFRTISPGASGVFTVGSSIESGDDFLANYPALMPTFPVHPQRYPPGLPLLFHWSDPLFARFPALSDAIGFKLRTYQCTDLTLMRLSNSELATAVLQMSLPLILSLIVFPIFGLTRRVMDEQTAVLAAVLYPLIPSFAMWSGRWDQFYPLLTVLGWYLLAVGLIDGKRWALFLSGGVICGATLLTFGNVAILAPMGLWALLWWWQTGKSRSFQRLVAAGLIFTAGLASLWLVYQLRFGLGFREIWSVSMGYHLGLARSYWTWLFYHLYDFGIFLSLPVLILFGVGLFFALKQWRRPEAALPLAFGISLLLLNISGTARGEVARVWLFLTPFAVITAAWGYQELTRRHKETKEKKKEKDKRQTNHPFPPSPPRPFAPSPLHRINPVPNKPTHSHTLLILTAVHLLTFNYFLRVVTTGVPDPISPPAEVTIGEIDKENGVVFGEAIYLLETNIAQGETLTVTHTWAVERPLAHSYTVFNHLLDENGNLVAQQDNIPLQSSYPTTCWQPGTYITDTYTIPLTDLPAGTYTLHTGQYILETGERLLIEGSGVDSWETAVEIE